MRFALRVRGTGRVEVAAYGVADAEHRVEKEIRSLWPDARVSVREVRRAAAAEARIAEEFALEYRVDAEVEVEADTRAAARQQAFRQTRGRLHGSPYWRMALDAEETGTAGGGP